MGADKATILVGEVPMARRVSDALTAAGCAPVIAVGGSIADARLIGIDHVVDDHPGEGPLGGILTALAVSAPSVVVACDLPRLDAGTVGRLIDALGHHHAAIACTDRPEPLCAVWSAAAAPLLRASFSAGERAVHRAIDGLDVAWVKVDGDQLRNVNTPDDLHSL